MSERDEEVKCFARGQQIGCCAMTTCGLTNGECFYKSEADNVPPRDSHAFVAAPSEAR